MKKTLAPLALVLASLVCHAAPPVPGQDYEAPFRAAAAAARRGTLPPPPAGVVDLPWRELSPPGYRPMKTLVRLKVGKLDDEKNYPAVMKEIRREWDQAPTVKPPEGKRVRMMGFALPLDGKEPVLTAVLSPFSGFDVQSPLPPANQLVLVTFDPPLSQRDARYPIWVVGQVSLAPTATHLARVAYRMRGAHWERFAYEKYALPGYQYPD